MAVPSGPQGMNAAGLGQLRLTRLRVEPSWKRELPNSVPIRITWEYLKLKPTRLRPIQLNQNEHLGTRARHHTGTPRFIVLHRHCFFFFFPLLWIEGLWQSALSDDG